MKLFVGIDVSSQSLDVCFLDSDSNVLHQGQLPNDINGASKTKELIMEFPGIIKCDAIKVGMEPTSVYSFHPTTFLRGCRSPRYG
jgi:transposase